MTPSTRRKRKTKTKTTSVASVDEAYGLLALPRRLFSFSHWLPSPPSHFPGERNRLKECVFSFVLVVGYFRIRLRFLLSFAFSSPISFPSSPRPKGKHARRGDVKRHHPMKTSVPPTVLASPLFGLPSQATSATSPLGRKRSVSLRYRHHETVVTIECW